MLDGLRVLDLTMWRPGPYTTQLLAQLGADVLKVEPPGGEPMRLFDKHFRHLNRGKRALVLNLKDDGDRARCRELASEADVVVTGFRPGVAERLGIGHAALRASRPALVTCSMTGYGEHGPAADLPGHDVNYRAMTGSLPQAAASPDADDLPVADMAAATMAAFAITAACFHSRATGEGRHLDLGMADVLAHWVATVPPALRRDADTGPVAGYGVYTCADGLRLTLGVVSEDHFWSAVCTALGLGRLADVPFPDRIGRVSELDAELAEAVRRLPRDEAVARLERAGAPVSPLLSREEMLALPHFRVRGVIADAPDGPTVGAPVRTDGDSPAPPAAVPGLDAHRGEGWLPR
ncbi:CoA transferase [Actinocorallia longicatena]|uniref:CaiB/BaiF CoA-transferase family protein n=1 Tax=Actinocorallia longicatena TaxID=111803 RepID=A0ABP6Q8U0_9ACTN